MAAKSSPGGFVVATVTNPGSFMATITHPTGNGSRHSDTHKHYVLIMIICYIVQVSKYYNDCIKVNKKEVTH